jgi:hypothetical protein
MRRIAAFAAGLVLIVGQPHAIARASAAAPIAAPADAYTGQLIDVERGYVVFANGDALRLAASARVLDARTGGPVQDVQPGAYGAASLDANGAVAQLLVSDAPFAQGMSMDDLPRADVVQASPSQANPDLASNVPPIAPSKLTKSEAVTITAFVPPTTPFTDDIYITTDTSGWNPQAVKMARIDGRRFRVTMDVLPGTQFHYLFTRGSWATVESDQAGLRRQPRTFFAQGAVAMDLDATVQRWIDLP